MDPIRRAADLIQVRLAALGLHGAERRVAAATNAGWLIAERLLSGLLAVTVTAAVTRHLGPAGFGVLSFALSFVLLFGTFWTLELSGLVIRELVREPDRQFGSEPGAGLVVPLPQPAPFAALPLQAVDVDCDLGPTQTRKPTQMGRWRC